MTTIKVMMIMPLIREIMILMMVMIILMILVQVRIRIMIPRRSR